MKNISRLLMAIGLLAILATLIFSVTANEGIKTQVVVLGIILGCCMVVVAVAICRCYGFGFKEMMNCWVLNECPLLDTCLGDND